MMDSREYPPPPFPCNEVPFDPKGPYAIDKTLLDDKQLSVWLACCNGTLLYHQTLGWDRLYYEFGVRQPALLVMRGWCYINLFAEADGVALLEEAQRIVGEGKDKLFDEHLDYLRKFVQRQLEDNDQAWDTLEDPETDRWHRKWVPLRPMPAEIPVSKELKDLFSEVQADWEDLKETLSPSEAVCRYNRLLSVQTNQLEGVFFLHDESVARLVCIGIFPPAIELQTQGSLYLESPRALDTQYEISCVCQDTLRAIDIVASQSENQTPIDTDSIKKIHVESTFHSRFMIIDDGPPPVLAAMFPGTFRQSVCSTLQVCDDETQENPGIVQFCNFRKVPEQMESLVDLFNKYLSAPTSPLDALRIAAWSHVWFVEIHPFGDGNGRVGRLLSSIPLLKCGLPPINMMDMGGRSLDVVKKEYIDALVQGQDHDNFSPLMEVILKGMLASLAYIRRNCLVMVPNDGDFMHNG